MSFGPSRAAAQSPDGAGASLKLTVSGSVTLALGDDGGETIDKFSTSSVKVSTSSLLKLFSAASGITYPTGAKLVLDISGDVMVEDTSGITVEDLTADGFLSIALDPDGAGVWSGQVNNDTGATKFSGSYIAYVSFGDPLGDFGDLAGLTKDSYSLTAFDQDGNQKGSDSLTITAVGEGSINGFNGIFSITIKGSGKA